MSQIERRSLLILIVGALALLLTPTTSGPREESSSPWQWPTGSPAAVLTPFAPPSRPWLAGHRGVDLAAEPGRTIQSAADGTVVFAGTVVDRPVVSVMHRGGLRTTYEPVQAIVVTGQTVQAGEPLGVLVEGHSPEGLHWGARFEPEHYVDPLRLLVGPSVLKPWNG